MTSTKRQAKLGSAPPMSSVEWAIARYKYFRAFGLILAGCAVPLAFVAVFLGLCLGIAGGFELFMLSVVITMGLIAFAAWVVVRCEDAPSSEWIVSRRLTIFLL